jgi:hypothetical protein
MLRETGAGVLQVGDGLADKHFNFPCDPVLLLPLERMQGVRAPTTVVRVT